MAHEYDYESEDFDFQCESFKSQVSFLTQESKPFSEMHFIHFLKKSNCFLWYFNNSISERKDLFLNILWLLCFLSFTLVRFRQTHFLTIISRTPLIDISPFSLLFSNWILLQSLSGWRLLENFSSSSFGLSWYRWHGRYRYLQGLQEFHRKKNGRQWYHWTSMVRYQGRQESLLRLGRHQPTHGRHLILFVGLILLAK